VLFLCGVQLVLGSGVLTILDLNEVDVTPSLVEVFRSVLSGVGGSTGGWRCCWDAPSLPQPGLNAKAKFHFRRLSYACYRCRLSFTLLRLLPSKGGFATTLCTDLPSATFSILALL